MILYLSPGFNNVVFALLETLTLPSASSVVTERSSPYPFTSKVVPNRFYLQIIAADDKALVFVLCHLKIGFSV